MEDIGLFPLGIVLLPTERVPLHIFEPRYRELIGECLEADTEFGVLYADEDGVRDIGTPPPGARDTSISVYSPFVSAAVSMNVIVSPETGLTRVSPVRITG